MITFETNIDLVTWALRPCHRSPRYWGGLMWDNTLGLVDPTEYQYCYAPS